MILFYNDFGENSIHMRNFEDKIKRYIDEYDMLGSGDKVIVGLSGGADSVCLLKILKKLGAEVYAVHINHMLRGEEADADEDFCRRLCEKLDVPFKVYHKDIKTYAADEKMTVEEAGRKFRYACFEEQRAKSGASKIAVAHNKNDLAETVIFNMTRGSGINGLSGIKAVRGDIIRPLLCVKRSEIEAYLEKTGQDFRTDSTNLSKDYDRNKIRHIVLPTLLEMNDGAIEHIADMADEANEAYKLINGISKTELERCTVDEVFSDKELVDSKVEGNYFGLDSMTDEDSERMLVLDKTAIIKLPKLIRENIIHEAIAKVAGKKKDITRRHIADVLELMESRTGSSVNLPYNITAKISYDKLIITDTNQKKNGYLFNIDNDLIEKRRVVISFSQNESLTFSIDFHKQDTQILKNNYTKLADYGKIKGALCIRTPKNGDYIIIDDKGNSKKLSRVFIDNKIDRDKRLSWPVVACGSEIIWAIGLRYSEAYKIDGKTEKILYMEYKQNA